MKNIWDIIIFNCHEFLDIKEFVNCSMVNRNTHEFLKNEYLISKLISIEFSVFRIPQVSLIIKTNQLPFWSKEELINKSFKEVKWMFDIIFYNNKMCIKCLVMKKEKCEHPYDIRYKHMDVIMRIDLIVPKEFKEELIKQLFPDMGPLSYCCSISVNRNIINVEFMESKDSYTILISYYQFPHSGMYDSFICGNNCTYDAVD